MIPRSRLSALLTLLFASLSAGCVGYSTYIDEPREEKPYTYISRITPQSGLTATISVTETGWLITAKEPIVMERVSETVITQRVQKYVFYPPSFLVGIIQCPFEGVVYAFSGGSNAAHLRNGCHRLMMFEPLNGNPEGPVRVALKTEQITDTHPARGRTIRIHGVNHPEEIVGVTNDKGQCFIPSDRVINETQQANLATQVHILEVGSVVWASTLPEISRREKASLAEITWPTPLIFEFAPIPSEAPVELIRFRQMLRYLLGSRGYWVNATPQQKHVGEEEYALGLTSALHGWSKQKSLHWTPATVLIDATVEHNELETSGRISWKNITTGTIITELQIRGELFQDTEGLVKQLAAVTHKQ